MIKTPQENAFKVQSRYILNPDEIIIPSIDLAEGIPLGNMYKRMGYKEQIYSGFVYSST